MRSSMRAAPARPASPPVAVSAARSINFTLTFPARISAAIQARARARGLAPEAWIREWVTVGLAEESIGAEGPQPVALSETSQTVTAEGRRAMPELKEWNTVSEVAAILTVSPSTLYRMIEQEPPGIGYVRISTGKGGLRIRREHVEAFLTANMYEVNHA